MYKVLLTIICFISIPLSCQTENTYMHNLCTTTINVVNNEVIEVESDFQLNEPIKNNLFFVVDNDIYDIKINGKTDYNYTINTLSDEKKINFDITKNISFVFCVFYFRSSLHDLSKAFDLRSSEG